MRKHSTGPDRETAATVVLADDHAVVRQGLRSLLESDSEIIVVGEAADGVEAVDMVKRHKPAVLIVDLMMPVKNGLEVARTLQRMKSPTRVIILSVYGDHAYLWEAFKYGAAGYLVKESCAAELFQAIRVVLAGGRYLSPTMSNASLDSSFHTRGMPDKAYAGWVETLQKLTSREQTVLRQVAEGASVHDSSTRLGLSPRKVEGHRADLMRKLCLTSHDQLIQYAVQRGIFPTPRPRRAAP